MVNEVPKQTIQNSPKAPKEREFANDYLDEAPNSAKTTNVRKRIIDGSRRCLEKA